LSRPFGCTGSDTVMDNATPQIATRRNQRDSSKCRRLALGT